MVVQQNMIYSDQMGSGGAQVEIWIKENLEHRLLHITKKSFNCHVLTYFKDKYLGFL